MIRASHIAAGVIVLLTALVLAWPPHDALRSGVTIRFTVWGMPFEDRLFLDRYARRWEELRPGVQVDYQRYGDDLLMKYNAWAARRRGPEVMRLRITDYHGMVARGMLEPLDPLILDATDGLSDAERAAFPPQLLASLRVDGRLFALPEDSSQFGLFFNRQILRDHNRSCPPADRVREPGASWTWGDLRRAARLLSRPASPDRPAIAGIDFAVWSWPFMTFYAQAGGRIWSDDGAECLPDTGAAVEALTFMRDLQRDGSFTPSLGAYNAGAGPEARFGAGRTALFLDGSWRVPNLEMVAPQLDFAVAPLPRGRTDAVVSGGVLWGISPYARHKNEAWRFLRWLVQEPQCAAYWDTLRVAPPANLAVLASDAFRSTRGVVRDDGTVIVPPMPPERFQDRAAWLLHATTVDPSTGRAPGFVPAHRNQTDLEREIERMLPEFLREGSTLAPDEAVRSVVEAVRAIVRRERDPPAR